MEALFELRATEALQNVLNYCWDQRNKTGDLEFVGFDGSVRSHRLILTAACPSGVLAKLLGGSLKDEVTRFMVPHASKDLLQRSLSQIYYSMNPSFLYQALDIDINDYVPSASKTNVSEVENRAPTLSASESSTVKNKVVSNFQESITSGSIRSNDGGHQPELRFSVHIPETRQDKSDKASEETFSDQNIDDLEADLEIVCDGLLEENKHSEMEKPKIDDVFLNQVCNGQFDNANTTKRTENMTSTSDDMKDEDPNYRNEDPTETGSELSQSKVETIPVKQKKRTSTRVSRKRVITDADHQAQVTAKKLTINSNRQPIQQRSKSNRRTYSEEQLKRALELIEDGTMNATQAQKLFGIPHGTLHNYMKRLRKENRDASTTKFVPIGHRVTLTQEEKDAELLVVERIQIMKDFGCYLETGDIPHIFDKTLPNSKEDFKMTVDKAFNFISRHELQNLVNVKDRRGDNLTEASIKEFFAKLEEIMLDVPAENVLTIEERGFRQDIDKYKNRPIFRRGSRYPRAKSIKIGQTSVLFAASPKTLLPPYVVFRNIVKPVLEDGPDDAVYNYSEAGWSDHRTFSDFFEQIIFPWADSMKGPKAVMVDCQSSHFVFDIVQKCKERDIRLVALDCPFIGWYVFQPLEKALFRGLIVSLREKLTQWILEEGTAFKVENFPHLLKRMLDEVYPTLPNRLEAEFKNSGIVPVNPEIILQKLPVPMIQ